MAGSTSLTGPELEPRIGSSPEPPEVDLRSNYPQTWHSEVEGDSAYNSWPLQSPEKEAWNAEDKEETVHQVVERPESSSLQDDEKAAPDYSPPKRSGRRKWIFIVVVVALCMFGAGIGAGYAVGTKAASEPWSAPARTDGRCGPEWGNAVCMPNNPNGYGGCCSDKGWCGSNALHCLRSNGCLWGCTSANSTSPNQPVTSGTTGIAAFSCNSSAPSKYTIENTSGPNTVFAEACYTDYLAGKPTWNATKPTDLVSEVASALTEYTFQSCMDQCAIYNSQKTANEPRCEAVTYSANLTWGVSSLGGNCFLKNARGAGYNGDSSVNYDLMASAYLLS